MKTNIAIFILVLILGAAGVVYVAFPEVIPFLNTTPQEQEGDEAKDDTPGYTITPVPIDDETALPNLDREVQFSEGVPDEARTIITNKVNTLQDTLREDPTNAGAWYDLAVYYHNANDYRAAEEVWQFLTEVALNDTTAYENLAKLYHFSLPDYSKSESYFQQSLAVNPDSVNPYIGLFELYRYSYKTETTAAADIMNQAIAKFPDKLDLILTLGVYYRDRGNYTKAREVLEEGLNKARDANDVNMIATFGQELERTPQ